jgi:GntR family transcriptional repressor for pyruvate dehydrogenase complex
MTDLFVPLRTETAYQQVVAAIEHKIISRELAAGEPLPTEAELARQFGVNRSTVREALRTLESNGLVLRPAGSKRLRVAHPQTEQVAAGISRALMLQQVTFLQVWEAMMLIEPEVAALAARRRSSAQLGELRVLVDGLTAALAEGTVPPDAAVEQAVSFFRLLGGACGNRALEMAAEPLTRLLRPTLRRMIDKLPQAQGRINEAQQALLEAMRRRNARTARDWMTRHIRDFRRGYEVAGVSLEARIEID